MNRKILTLEDIFRLPNQRVISVDYNIAVLEKDFIYQNESGISSRVVRARDNRLSTKDRLFQEFSAAFQFPYYFGWNWDALYECLEDFVSQQKQQTLCLIDNAQNMLSDDTESLNIFYSIIKNIIQDHALFYLILQTPEEHQEAFNKKYKALFNQ